MSQNKLRYDVLILKYEVSISLANIFIDIFPTALYRYVSCNWQKAVMKSLGDKNSVKMHGM